jgi:hypothetical protein
MIGRLVITSVPHGLGAGPGYQPVLRSRGMRPAVAERLRLRSGYPHPYPFGDARNPEVFFHLIESIGGQRLHVLARIGDAGSDYSGRSNRLSDLLVFDDGPCRAVPSGPAGVAAAFPWFRHWHGQACEVAEDQRLPAADDGTPAGCAAWAAATGDPGWAGHLAAAFLERRECLIISRPVDNVLRLYCEAMQLLPPDARWAVTFNTCELDPFPASWRAIRSDIGQIPRKTRAGVLLLDMHALATNRDRAPDHPYARFARGEDDAPWRHQASRADQLPFPQAAACMRGPSGEVAIGAGAVAADVGTEIRRRRQRDRARVAGQRSEHDPGPRFRGRLFRLVSLAVPVVTVLFGLGYLAWLQLDPDAAASMRSLFAPAELPSGSDSGPTAELETLAQQHAREQKEVAERRVRDEKAAEDKRLSGHATADAERARLAAERERADAETRRRTQEELQQREQQARDANRMKEALDAFGRLGDPVSIVPAVSSLDPTQGLGSEPISLGDFPVESLRSPSLALATPKSVKGVTIEVKPDPANKSTWQVLSRIPRPHDPLHPDPEERELCTLAADRGKLELRWNPKAEFTWPDVRLLRSSVLLVRCLDQDARFVERTIQLSEPMGEQETRFQPLAEKASWRIGFGDRLKDFAAGAIQVEGVVGYGAGAAQTIPVRGNQVITITLPFTSDPHVFRLVGKLKVDFQEDDISFEATIQPSEKACDWVPRVFTLQRLADYFEGRSHPLIDPYRKVLEGPAGPLDWEPLFSEWELQQSKNGKPIHPPYLPLIQSEKGFKDYQQQVQQEIQVLGRTENNRNDAERDTSKKRRDELREEFDKVSGHRRNWLDFQAAKKKEKVDQELDDIKRYLDECEAPFLAPVVLRVTSIKLIAQEPGGGPRHDIWITKPEKPGSSGVAERK